MATIRRKKPEPFALLQRDPGPWSPILLYWLATLGIIIVFGLVMLFSASYTTGYLRFGDSLHYIKSQVLCLGLGLVAMFLFSYVDHRLLRRLVWPGYFLVLALLVLVLFSTPLNGCKRWLVLPGLGTLQPSEIAKFAVVLVFAHIIALNHDRMGSFAVGVLPFALVLGAVAVLMLLEPHLSGTVLILGIGAVLMFVGGTGLKWFVLAGAGGAAAIGAAIIIMPDLVPYAASRLSSWLDPFADPLGDGHQTIQSLYAIGSGGAAGLGLGSSRQKHLFVPEPQNDFIFSILCEELGFVGACAVILLFSLLLRRYYESIEFYDHQQSAGTRGSFAQVLQYIQSRYQTVTLEQLAEVFHYNPSYLSRLIKKNTGQTLLDILTNLKMSRASDLLLHTTLKIEEIAALSGYQSVDHFSRLFKKRNGMSPQKYRQPHVPK